MKIVKKLYLSVISLVLLIITFSTATYAWFKINSSANIEGFDFQVQGGNGFVMSADGVNYKNHISAAEIKRLIIQSYDKQLYKYEEGKLMNLATNTEVTDQELDEILSKNVLMLPLTSEDGISLHDLYNADSTTHSGRYIEFSIYFKCVSNQVADNQIYDIYLNGEDITDERTGETVLKSSIASTEKTIVKLKAAMNSNVGNKNIGDEIEVYSSNALRFSIQDTSLDTPSATIYELSDDRSNDLGSYATDYNGADAELNKLYNADNNAMFTYYNNLRPSSKLKKLEYQKMPKTIRNLDTDDLPRVTRVKSGSNANLVTFRFWLEGWDADCFDGLAKSISVRLSFRSEIGEEIIDPSI